MGKPTNGGRVVPPAEHRFRKGTSGNAKGRPKGSISLKPITRKFALQKQTVTIGGKTERLMRLEIVIRKLQALAANGKPTAVRLARELRAGSVPQQSQQGGVLLVPEESSLEEFLAEEHARTANAIEPGSEVNVETEEFLKAVRGEPSELGEALLAFHRKYRGGNPT